MKARPEHRFPEKLRHGSAKTMYFQHNPIVQNLALKTCGLDAPPTRDFRHTQRALGSSGVFQKRSARVLHKHLTFQRGGSGVPAFPKPLGFGIIDSTILTFRLAETIHSESPQPRRQQTI